MSTSSSPPSEVEANSIPPRDGDPSTKLYTGGCHCGKFTFECRHPVLENGFEVVSCNCSICIQHGYLLIYIMDPQKDFTLVKGKREDLTKYNFNTGVVDHLFCPVCGCGIFAEAHNAVGVNLRAVTDVDLDGLKLKKHDGRAS